MVSTYGLTRAKARIMTPVTGGRGGGAAGACRGGVRRRFPPGGRGESPPVGLSGPGGGSAGPSAPGGPGAGVTRACQVTGCAGSPAPGVGYGASGRVRWSSVLPGAVGAGCAPGGRVLVYSRVRGPGAGMAGVWYGCGGYRPGGGARARVARAWVRCGAGVARVWRGGRVLSALGGGCARVAPGWGAGNGCAGMQSVGCACWSAERWSVARCWARSKRNSSTLTAG